MEDQKVGIDDSLECSFGGLFGGIFDTRGSKKIDTKSKDTKNNIRQDPETTTPRRDSTTGETDMNDTLYQTIVCNTYAKNILQILMNFGKKVKLEVVVLKVLVHRQPTLHQ